MTGSFSAPTTAPTPALTGWGVSPALVDLGVFVCALGAFGLTLAPGLQPADAGEYQLTGAMLGIAHPPGYAVYTLVSWLFASLLPMAPALAINALSAVLGAVAVTLIGAAARTFTGSRLAGLAAGLTLLVSTTFWAQATYANVRMPTAAALALAVYGIARLRTEQTRQTTAGDAQAAGVHGRVVSPPGPRPARIEDPGRSRPGGLTTRPCTQAADALHDLRSAAAGQPVWLALTSFGLGLAVSHHGSTVFLAAVLGLYALSLVPAVWRRPWPLLAGLIPFLAWLYFPLNAGGLGAPAGLNTWEGAWSHILARGFQGDMLAFATAEHLPERLRVLGVMLTFQWNPLLLTLITLGGALAVWADRRLGLALGLAWLVHTFIAITYRAPQTTEYLLPSYVLMALVVGFVVIPARATQAGGGRTAHGPAAWRAVLQPAACLALLALAIGAQAAVAWPAYRALGRQEDTRAFSQAVLNQAPAGSVILAPWHWATPLWYLQTVERQRPDVEVRYVLGGPDAYGASWVDFIGRYIETRPVVVTRFFEVEFPASGYSFVPLPTPESGAWVVMHGPPDVSGHSLRGEHAFPSVEFLGAQDVPSLRQDQYELIAAWDVAGHTAPLGTFVHVLADDGSLVAQHDIAARADEVARGTLAYRYTLTLPPGTRAGSYRMRAGLYQEDGTRVAELDLPPWQVLAQVATKLGLGTLPYPVSFGNTLLLQGVQVPAQARPGEALAVALVLQAVRPITQDLTLSLRLEGPGGWRQAIDATPVAGALPTLKWITGIPIHDRYTFSLPADTPAGSATLTLSWYDAFTERELPPLGTPLATPAQRVVIGVIEIR